MKIQFLIVVFSFFSWSIWALDETTLYQVTTDIQIEKSKSSSANIIINLRAKKPVKINKEAPISLKLHSCEGFNLKKSELSGPDGTFKGPTQIEWNVGAVVTDPDKQLVLGSIQFYLCSDNWCRQYEAKINQRT